MLIDEQSLLIFKTVNDDESLVIPEGFKLVLQDSNGTIQFVPKRNKANNQDNKHYLVNANKRWYRLRWGTRSANSSFRAHGEITIMITNNLRFIHKLSKPIFTVKDLQLFINDRLTLYLDNKVDRNLVINEVIKELNDEFESFGFEVSLIDFYKGVN